MLSKEYEEGGRGGVLAMIMVIWNSFKTYMFFYHLFLKKDSQTLSTFYRSIFHIQIGVDIPFYIFFFYEDGCLVVEFVLRV